MGTDLRMELAGFLRQESVSPQRSKEEKIAALLALGAYLDDPDSAKFLRQESLSPRRSLEEKVATLQALGTRRLENPPAEPPALKSALSKRS